MVQKRDFNTQNIKIYRIYTLKLAFYSICLGFWGFGMSNKRNIREILPADLSGKLRSKDDFYAYMDKHCKCINIFS